MPKAEPNAALVSEIPAAAPARSTGAPVSTSEVAMVAVRPDPKVRIVYAPRNSQRLVCDVSAAMAARPVAAASRPHVAKLPVE